MGTNYDTLMGRHIGKISALSSHRRRFIWAADPVAILAWLYQSPSEQICAKDEYGHEFSAMMMRQIIFSCTEQDYTCIGQEFS